MPDSNNHDELLEVVIKTAADVNTLQALVQRSLANQEEFSERIHTNFLKVSNLEAMVERDILDHNDISQRIRRIEHRMSAWGATISSVKFLGGLLILIVTLKIGDVKALFMKIFG